MTVINNRYLIILLVSIMLTLTQKVTALVVSEDCSVSKASDFYDLTAFEVTSYIPSVDQEGKPYLQGVALANAELNHYRNQYKDAPLVRMSIDRYAALTSKNPDALKNFESRLLIIDPECNELNLFFGNLIGTSELSLENYFQMFDTAARLDHEPLREFTEQRVSVRPMFINQVIEVLKLDLAFNVNLINLTLGDDFLKNMGIEKQNSFSNGGELALLSFVKKGGRLKNDRGDIKGYIILPESRKGLEDSGQTLMLFSNGEVHILPSLNASLAKYALGQLGVPTTILRVDRLFNDSGAVCLLDEVGHWYRMIKGGRKRNCNFNQILMEALRGDGWKMTFDEQSIPTSYQQIEDIIAQNKRLEFVY